MSFAQFRCICAGFFAGRECPQCIAISKKARTFSKMADGPNEFQLEQPPSDGISSVKFSPNPASFLVVSSWDTVRISSSELTSLTLNLSVSCDFSSVCFLTL